MSFVIADDSGGGNEQSIVFGRESLIPLPEDTKIYAMNWYFHPLIIMVVRNEEEAYFQEDEDEG